MQTVDYLIVAAYVAILLWLGVRYRLKRDSSASDVILGGRMLTLPAFVASLVSTWYGGILGVGEYSYNYGLSNWLVFGLPYYLAAFLFAIFLAEKARRSKLLTVPQQLSQTYDRRTGIAGSIIIFLMTVPAAYILMLGVLCEYLFGWPFWIGVLVGTAFSIFYVSLGGFRSVVRTDLFQFGLMFAGFMGLFLVLIVQYGGYSFLVANLPPDHLSWHGGNSTWYIAVWYVIALATLVEPAFYQRCYAAKTSKVARKGILISIGCWAFFDFMTTTCGLYARAVLPDLADPVASYPALAQLVLPAGMLGLFALALLATVMSTVDSYSFLAATTWGNDIARPILKLADRQVKRYTFYGLIISTTLAVGFALFFRSVVDIWHAFGSVGTPALLFPVVTSLVGKRRLEAGHAFLSIVVCGLFSFVWYLSKYFSPTDDYWLQVEPIFPGLILSAIIYGILGRKTR